MIVPYATLRVISGIRFMRAAIVAPLEAVTLQPVHSGYKIPLLSN